MNNPDHEASFTGEPDYYLDAMFCSAMPCNPIPFANALAEYVRLNGTASIQSDEAKQLLWVLINQAYGQLSTVDTVAEYERLSVARTIRETPELEQF